MSAINSFGSSYTQYPSATGRDQSESVKESFTAEEARQKFVAGLLRSGRSTSFATMMAQFTENFDATTLDRLTGSIKEEEEEEDEAIKLMRQLEETRAKYAEQSENSQQIQEFITKMQQTESSKEDRGFGEESETTEPAAVAPERDERFVAEEPLDDRDKYDYLAQDILARFAGKDDWQRNRDLSDLLVAEQEAKEKRNETTEAGAGIEDADALQAENGQTFESSGAIGIVSMEGS